MNYEDIPTPESPAPAEPPGVDPSARDDEAAPRRARMRLGDWASLAEIVTALGVIISLLYVGLEVRANTRAIQAAAIIDINNIARQQILLLAGDADLNRIGTVDPSQLTEEERQRRFWIDRSFWLGMQTVFRQWQLGVLPDEEWAVYRDVICRNVADPTMRADWPEQRSLIPAFVNVVESCETFRR